MSGRSVNLTTLFLGGLSLPRKSVVRLTDRPNMTLDVYRGRKTTIQSSRAITLFGLYKYMYKQSYLVS